MRLKYGFLLEVGLLVTVERGLGDFTTTEMLTAL